MDGEFAGKEKQDQSKYAEEKISEAKRLLDASVKLEEVLEILYAAEKKCRLSNDALAAKSVAEFAVNMFRERKEWSQMELTLTTLAKRRSQSKAVISGILAVGISSIEEMEEIETREKVLRSLSDITEGRMYCELERAKITRTLAQLYEGRGDIAAASDEMQKVNAETYGSLSKREKVDFILEQMRLLLAKKDRVRTYIVSKKIQKKTLAEADLEDLKIRFYRLMINYHAEEQLLLDEEKDQHHWTGSDIDPAYELAQHYWHIYDTPSVKQDKSLWMEALASSALFLMLSEHSPQVQTMTHTVLQRDDLGLIQDGLFKRSLELFMRQEIIPEPMPDQQILQTHIALSRHGQKVQDQWTKTLHTRIVEHNIRVVAKYYQQITIPRLAQLLKLDNDDTEKHLSHMVSHAGLYCKIDRPAAIANFAQPKPSEEILSDWAADISKMLNLVEMTCHLINKEIMIHKL